LTSKDGVRRWTRTLVPGGHVQRRREGISAAAAASAAATTAIVSATLTPGIPADLYEIFMHEIRV